MTTDAVVTQLAERGVRFVRVMHADPFGRARSKDLPLTSLPMASSGLAYCAASLVESLQGDPLMDASFPGGQGFPDLQARADLATARVTPWDPSTAWVLADLVDHGSPSPLCARGTLRRVVGLLAARGLHAVTASEPEFYLLRELPDGRVERYSPGTGQAYTTGRRADPDGVLRRIHEALDAFGLQPTTAHREFSPGQFEINLAHGEALESADRAFLLEEVIKDVAAGEGLLATFMAKPFADDEGSSHHLHVSLWRGDENLFDGPDGLSPLGLSFAAGLLTHAAALTAIASPTVNSYKRLGSEGLAPSLAELGGDNRYAWLRVPGERGPGRRIEIRAGDASANPYLLTAAVLAAGLDGVERELSPDGLEPERLPRTLETACDALEADEALCAGLGEELVRVFCALKRDEAHRYSRTVTDWEWREYARHA